MWDSVRQARKTHIELYDGTVVYLICSIIKKFFTTHLHLAGLLVHETNNHKWIIHSMFTNIISSRQFASNLWYCANVVLMSSLAQSSCSISFSSLSLGMSSTIRPCISLVMEWSCYWPAEKRETATILHIYRPKIKTGGWVCSCWEKKVRMCICGCVWL